MTALATSLSSWALPMADVDRLVNPPAYYEREQRYPGCSCRSCQKAKDDYIYREARKRADYAMLYGRGPALMALDLYDQSVEYLSYDRMMNEVIRTMYVPSKWLARAADTFKLENNTMTTSTAPSPKPVPLPIQSLLNSRASSISQRANCERDVKEYQRLAGVYQDGVDKYDAQVKDYDKALKKLGYVAPKAPK